MVANPSPLGLFAFSVTSILLGFVNAGISEHTLGNLGLAHGLFYGGLAQCVASMWEFAAGNTFPATTFGSYGSFYISIAVYTWVAQTGLYAAAQEVDMALFYSTWACFTVLIWIITLRMPKVLIAIFTMVVLLFAFLAMGEYSTACLKLGGWFGIATGLVGFYAGFAMLLNETWKGEFLPLGASASHGHGHGDAAENAEKV